MTTNTCRSSFPEWLGTAVLAASLGIVFLSLPAFHIGYWIKAEGLQIALHGVCALGSIALSCGLYRRPDQVWPLLRHPLCLLPLGLGIFSLVGALFLPHPFGSLLGTPQTGLGGLWFLDLFVLVGLALMLRPHGHLWSLLLWVLFAACLGMAGLKAYDWRHQNDGFLLHISSFYAPIALSCLAVAFGLAQQGAARRMWVCGLAAGILALAAARSFSASFGLVPGLLGGLALWFAARKNWPVPVWALGGAFFLALTGPFVFLSTGWGLSGSASLWDRHTLQMMFLADPLHWQHWIIGHGWGDSIRAMRVNTNAAGMVLWDLKWIFLQSEYPNSHNWLRESFHSLGVPGVLLQGLALLSPFLWADRSARATAFGYGLTMILFMGFWFEFPFCLGFQAMAIGTLAARPGPAPQPQRLSLSVLAVLLSVLAAGQAAAAFQLTRQGLAIDQFQAGLTDQLPMDLRGDHVNLASLVNRAFEKLEETGPTTDTHRRGLSLVSQLAHILRTDPSPVLLLAGIETMTRIHSTRTLHWLGPDLGDSIPLWEGWVTRLLEQAPGRVDVAIPFLTHRAMAGDLHRLDIMVSAMLGRNGNDPVGLYFLGLRQLLSADPTDKGKGIETLRRSADAGISRFMPLDPTIRQLIGR